MEEIQNGIVDILTHYTNEQQVMQSVEEMSELIKELLKNINRGKDNIEEIKDELADVTIMAMQLAIIYDATDLQERVANKVNRQLERIKKENRYGRRN